MELYRKYKDGLNFLTIEPIDLYESIEDRIALKEIFNKLFDIGDEVFCYFRRKEDLTDDKELVQLKDSIFTRFNSFENEFKYIFKIDERRFDAIGKLKLEYDFSNAIIEMWKCFYSLSFFIPINGLTFEEYEEYLEINGVDDVYAKRHIYDKLASFVCTKGLGGDYFVITSDVEIGIDVRLI